MIIPNKHSGYQAGIRLYPSDGGGPDAGPASGTDAGAGLTGASPPSGFADSNAGESSSLGTYYGGQFGAGPAPNLGANPSNADVGINYGEGVSAPQGTGVGGYASPGPSGFFGSGYDGLFGPSSNSYLGTTINSGGGSFDSGGGGVGGNIPAIVNRPTRQTGYGSPTYNTQPIYRQPIYRGPTSRNYFNPAQQFNNNTSVYGTGRQYSNPYQPQQQYNPYPPQQQYNPYQMQSPFSYQPQQRYNPYQQPQQSRRSPMGGRRYAEGGIAGILKK